MGSRHRNTGPSYCGVGIRADPAGGDARDADRQVPRDVRSVTGKTKAATLRMLKRELGKTKLASLSAVVLRDFIDRRIAEPGEAIKRVADHFEVDESTIAKIFRERRDAVARSGWIVNTNLAQRAGAIRGEQRLGRFARCRHHLPEGGHMMAMTDTSSDNEASIRELARSLDCILDSELQAIGEVKSSTTAAWRRRGKEPAYIVFGNAILYPRAAVAEYLQSPVRARCHESARGPRGGEAGVCGVTGFDRRWRTKTCTTTPETQPRPKPPRHTRIKVIANCGPAR